MSPTQRTLAELRKRGYECVQIVEHWNPFAKRRVDLWTFVDVIGIAPDNRVTGIQCTSRDNVSARVTKIVESPNLPVLQRANVRILVWGWGKMASGKYELREVDLS